MNESAMNEILDSIVDGLFSVCVTLGVIPIIRCPKNGAAEQVSEVRKMYLYLFNCFYEIGRSLWYT